MEIIRPIVQEEFIPVTYTSSPEIIKNCLKEVLEGSTLEPQAGVLDNTDMTKKQKEQIIKTHMENFTTKYYESDRRWHSFLPDETHPRKQRPIAKRRWEDLEQTILDFYESQKAEEQRKKITLRTLYPEWFEYKWQDTNNSNYMKHIDGEWKRFYLKDEIIDKPIVEFTALQLKEWARKKIISEKMTKKQYYNMAIIIRQSLDYLVERGELTVNHYNEFKVNTSLFKPVTPKEPEYEVFSEKEEKDIKEMAMTEFKANPERTAPLAVVLNFSLGLRVGELLALKWKDLKEPYLQIRRMEQRQYTKDEKDNWKLHIEVVEHTKSDAGIRKIYVVSSALEIFKQIKESNLNNGYSCEPEDFIFMLDYKRMAVHSMDWYYQKYCRDLGIVKKGNHKVRKTALTKIGDNPNINLKDAMEFAGHKDVKTFITHYCFSRYSDEKKRIELEKTLNS